MPADAPSQRERYAAVTATNKGGHELRHPRRGFALIRAVYTPGATQSSAFPLLFVLHDR